MTTFYDIHCHAFNLNHPCLTAFLERTNLHAYLILNALPGISAIASGVIGSKEEAVMNLMSVMENEINDIFLLVEQDIKSAGLFSNGKLVIGAETYDRIILTPLVMDFGMKKFPLFPNIHYNRPASKPVVKQVIDLFNGIKAYKDCGGILEIYPFLGLNTRNYDLDGGPSPGKPVSLQGLLDKYFGNFTAGTSPARKDSLRQGLDGFDGNIDHLGNFAFAGIKLYPPLGFDPWPDDPTENRKVCYLYQYCVDKAIPITTHCSDGGFITDDRHNDFTDPSRWEKVLQQDRFLPLKLNFAHYGTQKYGKTWRDKITELIVKYPNVYTDFSYGGVDDNFYCDMMEHLSQQPTNRKEKLKQRILFGSDFLINLLDTDSYAGYLKRYSVTTIISNDRKKLFCSDNPERFLFGAS